MAASIEARVLADDELFITRTFDAPVAVVWRLWEDPKHMIRWWGPEGFTVTELEQDFRPGGAWRICMVSEAYPISWSSGRFLELDRHERIVMTFAWEDGSGETTPTTITITFEERDGRTIQRFHQTPFTTRESRDSHHQGWNSLFNKEQRYAEALATGVTLPQLG